MSRQWCHRATTHPFIPSRGKKRKEVGGALLVQADEENKQLQIWFLVEVGRASRRVCIQTHLHSSRFSLHPPRHPSIHQRGGFFTFGAAVSPLSVISPYRWGRSTPSQLGDSDFHATSPPSPQARGYKKPKPPITPRCGIGLKEPHFARRCDHQPRRNPQPLK